MDCGIPFCHEGCPLGQPHPRVERPRVPRRLVRRPSSGCTPPTTSPSSPGGCARRPARRPACSASTPTRSPSSGSSTRSPSGPGTRAGCGPRSPRERTGKRVAVVGSGPAGLAGAQQLARAGHSVVVFERAEQPGRPAALRHPRVQDGEGGPRPPPGPAAGRGGRVPLRDLGRSAADADAAATGPPSRGRSGAGHGLRPRRHRGPGRRGCVADFDAVVLAGGATLPRDLDVPGRDARRGALRHGVPEALQPGPRGRARPVARSRPRASTSSSSAGGDTGADCLGTAHRQGAASVHQLEIMPEPPERPGRRAPLADVAAHPADLLGPRGGRAGGCSRSPPPSSSTTAAGAVRALRGHQVEVTFDGGRPVFTPVAGSEFELPLRPGAAGHGLPGRRAPRRGGRAGPRARPPGRRGRRRRTGPPTSRGSSSAAT